MSQEKLKKSSAQLGGGPGGEICPITAKIMTNARISISPHINPLYKNNNGKPLHSHIDSWSPYTGVYSTPS